MDYSLSLDRNRTNATSLAGALHYAGPGTGRQTSLSLSRLLAILETKCRIGLLRSNAIIRSNCWKDCNGTAAPCQAAWESDCGINGRPGPCKGIGGC